jgi:hypothetical protein
MTLVTFRQEKCQCLGRGAKEFAENKCANLRQYAEIRQCLLVIKIKTLTGLEACPESFRGPCEVLVPHTLQFERVQNRDFAAACVNQVFFLKIS